VRGSALRAGTNVAAVFAVENESGGASGGVEPPLGVGRTGSRVDGRVAVGDVQHRPSFPVGSEWESRHEF